jgi:hypothetical protein
LRGFWSESEVGSGLAMGQASQTDAFTRCFAAATG